MTNPKYTRLYALLDRSGSMFQIKADTEGGFNSYIKEQKKVPGSCDVTLVQFDAPNFRTFYAFPTDKPSAEDEEDWYKVIYRNKPIREVPKLTLVPRGGTALHDALGRLITEAGQELAALPEDKRPGVVEVLVLTDGEENSSTHWHIESFDPWWAAEEDLLVAFRLHGFQPGRGSHRNPARLRLRNQPDLHWRQCGTGIRLRRDQFGSLPFRYRQGRFCGGSNPVLLLHRR
jgi:hypothetical protein